MSPSFRIRVLGYSDYRNFEQVIKKAKKACFNSGHRIEDHFVDITEMIEIGKEKANRTHREVGQKVRQTIEELGGTMPENLPVAEDIKKLETKQRKRFKDRSE